MFPHPDPEEEEHALKGFYFEVVPLFITVVHSITRWRSSATQFHGRTVMDCELLPKPEIRRLM
jgi:hypothetical protein